MSDLLPVGQILTVFGLGGALIFAAIALRQGDALMTPDVVSPAMRIRVHFEITGRLFYVLALLLPDDGHTHRDVSAVTPFRYTRLLFGAALRILLFGESLTMGMLVGSGLIVLSGLFIMWRGQKRAAEVGATT